jgi:hypothetical protein
MKAKKEREREQGGLKKKEVYPKMYPSWDLTEQWSKNNIFLAQLSGTHHTTTLKDSPSLCRLTRPKKEKKKPQGTSNIRSRIKKGVMWTPSELRHKGERGRAGKHTHTKKKKAATLFYDVCIG